jgi:hypothetical protein
MTELSKPRQIANLAKDIVSVKDYGAVGDGVVDDTAAIQAAIDYCITNNRVLYIPYGVYYLSSTLDLVGTSFKSLSIVGDGYSTEKPTLEFHGVDIGLDIQASKGTGIKNIKINMVNANSNCIGIACYGMWYSKFEDVVVVNDKKATVPSVSTACYGILFRPTANGTVTVQTMATVAESIKAGNTGLDQGVYWNSFERLDVSGWSYGLTMLSSAGGTNARTNQCLFNACEFNQNHYDVWCEGTGGGITFNSCTAESAQEDGVRIESVSSGTSPVWIGGELSGTRQWVGPGLLLNPVAGTSIVNANGSGDTATHMRFTDQGAQVYGTKLNGANWLTDWADKQDIPLYSTGATVGKTANIATFTTDASGGDAAVYEISVAMTDNTVPQGYILMVYHIHCTRWNGGTPTALATLISEKFGYTNLGGGTVNPDLTVSVASNTVTVAANINWDSVGSDPGEANYVCNIRELAKIGAWTAAAV